MSAATQQDAQIFKERCEDSPGILILCQGDWRPTPERIRLFEEQNYYVMTAANGFQDITDWLPLPRCMGGMFAHPETVAQARQQFPDKVIERFEGVGARFLRSLTQELPYGLHNAGAPFNATTPAALRTVDVVSVFSPVALKRGQLLIEALIESGANAYVFAQSLGSNPQLLETFNEVLRQSGKSIEYFHYPFDPYALMRIDGRIVIDGRPIGANNSIVSAYLARARLFVHTSTTEGISNSIMEALMNDVPVLICDDIRGPQQGLSQRLPQCIFRSAPAVGALAANIQSLLARKRQDGQVRADFRQELDPFLINQRVVRAAQNWFARHGLPWKGHCLGLLGGVQSKIDLSTVSAEESYRGGRHIYPSPVEAAQCAAFQGQIAQMVGRSDLAAVLQAEFDFITAGKAPLLGDLPQGASQESGHSDIFGLLAALSERAELKRVLMIGAAADLPRSDALISALARNPSQPRLTCIEMAPEAGEVLAARYREFAQFEVLRGSSVALGDFPADEDIQAFYRQGADRLSPYPEAQVLQWLHNDRAAMAEPELEDGLVAKLLEREGNQPFDMVVIDGREFTGYAEFSRLKGAGVIVLGCTRTFKNRRSFAELSGDPDYDLVCTAPEVGNGYAIFVRRSFRQIAEA